MGALREVIGFAGLVLVGMLIIAALTTDPASIEQLVEIHMGALGWTTN